MTTAGTLALAGALRVWITTDSGRDFIVSRLNGLDLAGYGTLQLEGLQGDPLSDFSLSTLKISNHGGTWLEAENIHFDWSPWSLLTNTLRIKEVGIERLTVFERPEQEGPRPEPSEGGSNLRVDLNSLVLQRLILADGVAGPESISEISARFVQQRSGALDAALRLRPIAGRGDRVDLLIVMTASKRFDITAIADAPAGGFFSHMLNLEPGSAARLEANGAGDLRNGVGEARFSIDRNDKAYFSAKMEDGQLAASARLDASALPLPAEISAFLGKSAEASLAARFDQDIVDFEFDALVSQGDLHLSGQADTDKNELVGPAKIRLDLGSLRPFWENGAGIQLDGDLTFTGGVPAYNGPLRLVSEDDSVLPFEAASGLVNVSYTGADIPFEGNFELHRPIALGELIDTAIGSAPKADLRGAFSLSDMTLQLESAELLHDSGSLRAAGEIDLTESRLRLAGRIAQSVPALLDGFQGNIEGHLTLDGAFDDLDFATNLNLRNLSGPDAIAPLIAGSGQASARVKIASGDISAEMVRVNLPGLRLDANGFIAGHRPMDLHVRATQTAPIETGGTLASIGELTGHIKQSSDGLNISASTHEGFIQNGDNSLTSLSITTTVAQEGDDISGPVRVTGRFEEERVEVSALFERTDRATRINDLTGFIGKLRLAGHFYAADEGAFNGIANLSGDSFDIAGISFGKLLVDARIEQEAGESLAVSLDADVQNTTVSDDIRFDRLRANIRTIPDGYDFSAHLEDATRGRETNLRVGGFASLSDEAPNGTLNLSGSILGQTVSTRRNATWKLGNNPDIDADLDIMGGNLQARLITDNQAPLLSFTVQDVDAGPLLAAFKMPVSAARIDGNGAFRPYGTNPTGSFDIRTSSPVTGLDGAIDLDLTGQLNARDLTIEGSANYGPTLQSQFSVALPMVAMPEQMVQVNMQAPLRGQGTIRGNLEAVRQVSLAYGHDIGGDIDASAQIGGSAQAPQINATADIKNGLYEYGAMGFRLARFDLKASYTGGDLVLTANGQGPDGGTLSANGQLSSAGAGQVDIELKKLLVYDRNRDKMRLTGKAALTETQEARVIRGAMSVDEAAFSLDNLPASGVRRLDVRWKENLSDEPEEPVLEKPIQFDFAINSDRRIFIDGRGLTSEWGMNVNITGSPSAPQLNGRATLIRGQLELARRPFVFDNGVVTFDGPPDSAQVEISADREVDGFTARVEVTGSPASPRIELSSTPELPQDEILSRMLFGRSAMDLTALEAAELASSIATLSGQGGGFNPIGQLQAGLGLDRLRLGVSDEGTTEVGVGQYLAPDVYLEVTTAGAAGNSVEVEWQPRPRVSVTSEARSTGESRVSVRWKRDY